MFPHEKPRLNKLLTRDIILWSSFYSEIGKHGWRKRFAWALIVPLTTETKSGVVFSRESVPAVDLTCTLRVFLRFPSLQDQRKTAEGHKFISYP